MRSRLSPRGWSIRVKSVVLGVGFLSALSAVYGAFTVYLYRIALSQAHERLEQTARIVAAELDDYVATGKQRLETISHLPGLAYGLQTIQGSGEGTYIPPWTTLHYLFFRSPIFTSAVFLLDRAGNVLWTEPPGLPWHGRTILNVAPVPDLYRAPGSFISGILGGDLLSSRPHVVIGSPIRNQAGELQGILAGVIDVGASEFGAMLGALSTTGGRFVEVVDRGGMVLASTDSTRLLRPANQPPRLGDPPMTAAVAMSEAPWEVIAGQPRSLGLAPVRRLQHALWIIGIAILIGSAAVAAPVLNDFVRSIKQLTEAAETVARGDLSQPVVISGRRRDELATLAQSFEQMRVELGRSRRALEHRLEERESLIGLLMRSNEELHAAQARLVEAERLAAIGELSAAVAHGIRNPLAGIKAAAQCAALDLASDHPVRESIRDIIGEADRLEARVKTLLDFAKPFEPHPAPCRIDQIVADAVSSLRSQLTTHGVDVLVDIDPTLPAALLDDSQIEQVLLALLSNAIEAMPAGGRITVAGRATADDSVHLTVSDTGPGIPPEQLDRWFKLFFTTKSSGTGLGLAVAKKIIERHNGTISVESEIGKGTRFTIEIPLKPRI